jgi:non-specific serine/threonine protein kinase/serine/threonine-protein kinase
MEYVDGIRIDDYCDQHGLSITERLRIFRQVCAAVSYAHRRAIIHRDLKPSNILVTSEGVPKLLDFGIAKILQPGNVSEPAVTMIGLHVMTPEYASPEQVRGEAVTTASDVYSLGVVLYRLLTGCLPYRLPGQPVHDLARAMTEAVPQRPSAASPGFQTKLRGDLDNIVLMALRKEPERRYQSVEQFSEDIRRHLESLPVLARRDTLAYRTAKFVRRNTAATAAAALIVLSLVGGMVATSWQAHRAEIQEARAKAEKARAERRFNEVRQLAHSVLFDYHDAIKDLQGATAVRERLVKDGLKYLDSLAGESSGEPALQRELAAAYERLGDVRGQAYSAASLGDLAGAIDSYMKALKIRKALVTASPEDVQNRRDLAGSYLKVGGLLIGTAESNRGRQYLQKGLALQTQLAADQPQNTDIRSALAATHNMVGLALEDLGDAAGALENHRRALALREALVASDPGNHTYRRHLSITYISLGRVMVLSGDIKAGLESNRKALAMCEALLAENPSSADYRRILANTYSNDGDYRAILHDVDGALQSFRKKLALDEKAFADDPLNAVARGDVAYSHERMGNLLAESGDHRQALVSYRKALPTYEKMTADAPAAIGLRYRLLLTLAGIAEMEAQLGDRAGAIADFSRAAAVLNETPADPQNSAQSSARGQVYLYLAATHAGLAESNRADLAQRREHWRAARDMYLRSQAIWQDMQTRGILTGDNGEKPQEVVRGIAQCDEALRRLSAATAG